MRPVNLWQPGRGKMIDSGNVKETEPWRELVDIVQGGDVEELDQYLESLPPGEPGRALSRMTDEEQAGVLELLPDEEAAELLEKLPEELAVQLIEHLPVEEAASIFGEIESRGQAELLTRFDEEEAVAILDHLEPEEANNVRVLAEFPRDSAGGLMVTEYLVYQEDLRVKDVLDDLRDHSEEYSSYGVQYAYVVSPARQLVGVLRFRDLLLTSQQKAVRSIMIDAPICVTTAMGLEELKRLFDECALQGLPVVDDHNHLMGIVSRSDAERAIQRRASQTLLKFTGIVGGEELRSMPLLLRSRRRLSWLSVNILLNVLAASVIAWHQDTLSSVIALAVFLPIISDMSGCSGNQAVAVSMRELALGLVKPYEHLRVLWKEAGIGIVNGAVLGAALGGVAFLWKGNPMLGLVVGAALALNTVLAVCLGGAIPLLLRRANQDPAIASGPILTTVTDMCGFLFVLSFARITLPWLVTT